MLNRLRRARTVLFRRRLSARCGGEMIISRAHTGASGMTPEEARGARREFSRLDALQEARRRAVPGLNRSSRMSALPPPLFESRSQHGDDGVRAGAGIGSTRRCSCRYSALNGHRLEWRSTHPCTDPRHRSFTRRLDLRREFHIEYIVASSVCLFTRWRHVVRCRAAVGTGGEAS